MREWSSRSKVILSVLVLLVAGLSALLGIESLGGDAGAGAASSDTSAAAETVAPRGVTPAAIPPRAFDTLAEIDDGGWPDSANAPGTKGGLTWQNRSGDLPRDDVDGARIAYQEWDVNPKRRDQSRDAERIVTGSDGSAWYTDDHYTSFTRMR